SACAEKHFATNCEIAPPNIVGADVEQAAAEIENAQIRQSTPAADGRLPPSRQPVRWVLLKQGKVVSPHKGDLRMGEAFHNGLDPAIAGHDVVVGEHQYVAGGGLCTRVSSNVQTGLRFESVDQAEGFLVCLDDVTCPVC